MSETELGNLSVVSLSMSSLTSLPSPSVNRVSDFLTSSVSLAQRTPRENNNLTENRSQMFERNISSLGKTFKRLNEAKKLKVHKGREGNR